jgi:hypothetical protein
MRKIQQLVYDSERRRLFCPEHPNAHLDEASGYLPDKGR